MSADVGALKFGLTTIGYRISGHMIPCDINVVFNYFALEPLHNLNRAILIPNTRSV
jgi:hypothetical protein